MTVNTRPRVSRSCNLKDYCSFSDEHGFAEVTEWSNGEGFDITIQSKSETRFLSLTHGEWQCLQVLSNYRGNNA